MQTCIKNNKKMEKEKYYTPTIEEFHVGFEFEMLDSCPDTGQNMWCESTFGNLLIKSSGGQYSISLKDYIEYIKNEEVRIKYLDREDIESFGLSTWNDTDINIYSNNQYKTIIYRGSEINLSCVYNKRSNWICVAIEDKWIEKSTSNTLFAGYIKNKSEFSRLLKQLSII